MACGIPGPRSSIQLTIDAARIAILVVLVCFADTPFVAAQEPVAAARQTFRTRTELVRLEVSVLDNERSPVRGLQSSDFRIEIDGVTRPVVFAEEVNVAGTQDDRGALPAVSGVTTNDVADARLFVIIMDDGMTPGDPFMGRTARQAAQEFVRGLVPGDLVAVVYTWDIHKGQEFTANHDLALAAIDRFRTGPPGPPNPLAVTYQQRTIASVLASLQAMAGHRRAVLLLSHGVVRPRSAGFSGFTPEDDFDWVSDHDQIVQTVGRQNIARIPVYAIDIGGLVAPTDVRIPGVVNWVNANWSVESLQSLASLTGGAAVTRTNDPLPGVRRILRENASYYVLGYEPVPITGRRSPRVKVSLTSGRDRTLLVRQYSAPVDDPAAPASSVTRALAGFLPTSGVPIRLIARALPMTDANPELVVALQIGRSPGDRDVPSKLTVEWHLFDEHKQVHVEEREISGAELVRIGEETMLFLRTSVNPGRYHLRVALRGESWRSAASVFGDLVIPRFGRTSLASDVLLLSDTSAGQVPASVSALVPALPAFDSTFGPGDRLRAFIRTIPADPPQPGQAAILIQNAEGRTVHAIQESQVSRSSDGAATGYVIDVPLAGFSPGQYRIVATVTAGSITTTSGAGFVVQK